MMVVVAVMPVDPVHPVLAVEAVLQHQCLFLVHRG
jgi:hypothetical protein